MQIYLRNAGFSNKGAEAMLITCINEIQKRLPSATFKVCLPKEQIKLAKENKIISIPMINGKYKKLLFLLKGFITNNNLRRAFFINKLSAIEIGLVGDIDVIIDIGGFTYGDDWGIEAISRSLAWTNYCKNNNKKYLFMPQAWGPFSNRKIAKMAKRMLIETELICSRDCISTTHLNNLLCSDVLTVYTAPDIAFAFEGKNKEYGQKLLRNLGIDQNKEMVVAIAPNLRVYERTEGKGNDNVYYKALYNICKCIIEEKDANLVFISNETAIGGKKRLDDRFLCKLLEKDLSNNKRKIHLFNNLSAAKTKGLLNAANLLVGSRYHALLFSMCSNTPALAIGWSHKYIELMRSVGLENCAVPISEINSNEIIKKVNEVWAERYKIKKRLKENITLLKNDVKKYFDMAAEAIKS